jgi:hypothetical protein
LLVAGLAGAWAHADSAQSACMFAENIDTARGPTTPCLFSQRRGFVGIDIGGGPRFDFRPVGDAPGNFLDEDDRPVYRRSGLGDAGQIFKLPDNRFLFVYWDTEPLACSADELAGSAPCNLALGGVSFQVQATNVGSINQLTLQPAGLEFSTEPFLHEIDGTAYGAEIADLDANGWPEVYVYVASAGSGSYGSLVAYGVNAGRSASPIYLPPLTDDAEASAGYQGHDEFAVVENRLVRRFPVYNTGDTNSEPTGGMRQVQYKLIAGEAGWLLRADRVVAY